MDVYKTVQGTLRLDINGLLCFVLGFCTNGSQQRYHKQGIVMISRNMVYITAFFALSLTISEALGVRLCGKQLADMLDLVCDGRGFHWQPRNGRLPQIRKRNAVQYLLTTPTPVQAEVGIVSECCRQACSISDMESYCAASPGTYIASPTNAPLTRELANEIINSGLRVQYPPTGEPTPVPPTTLPPNMSVRPGGGRLLSRMRPHGQRGNSGGLFRSSSKFFFVRPVGPRPTRTPVV